VETSTEGALRKLILAMQALAIVLAMVLAGALHQWTHARFDIFRTVPSFDQFAILPFVTLPLLLGLLASVGLHRIRERLWSKRELFLALLKVHVGASVLLAAFVYFTQSIINRSLTLLFLGFSFLLLFALCAATNRWRRYQHESGQGRERLLLIGEDGAAMSRFVAECERAPLPPEIVGVLSNAPVGSMLGPSLGAPSALSAVLHENAVDRVLFFPPLHRSVDMEEALTACELLGIPGSFWVETADRTAGAVRMDAFHGQLFVSFESRPRSPEALALKYGADLISAALLLILLAPVMLLVSLAIWITMGRPIFFSQLRAGLHGRVFRMLKFRTMVRGAERAQEALAEQNEMSGPVFKIKEDPRITPLGRMLRRTSLDELPQLFHVLEGKMSLVGPRPLPLEEQRRIEGWHRRRLAMKPGLTGPWQVSGRNDIDFDEWMRLDLDYVDGWHLGRDVTVLLQTIPAVLFGRGAH
jgi:exopolysaccharide biosynthesis polyprenyl glycosylphosphotransferase